MPEFQTRHFGLVSCNDEATLLFPEGLPAFESAKNFVLVDQPAFSPAVFLQSLDFEDLCFILLPIQAVDAQYQADISAEDLRILGLPENPTPGGEVACFAVLSVTENGPPTANLLAPVVINLTTRTGVQAIRLDRRYSHQHPVGGASCL